MWRSRIFWHLLLTYIVLVILTVGLLGFVVGRQVEYNQLADVEEQLRAKAALLRELLRGRESTDPLYARLAKHSANLQMRVTVIGTMGCVLLETDHDSETMDNHKERPEITQARYADYGKSIRYSDTIEQDMMYVALAVEDAHSDVAFIRVSLPLTHIRAHVAGLQRLVWIAAGLTALLALGVAFFLGRRIVSPLEQLSRGAEEIAAGAYGHKVVMESNDEIGQLAAAFNHMSERLASQFTQLDEDRQQLRTVLSSMVEGVVAVDNDQRVLFANERAGHLLDFPMRDSVGRHLWELTRLRPVQDLVRSALASAKPVEKELSWTGPSSRTLLVHAARLPGDPSRGVLLVLHDNTQLRRLERVRREFVANVSHELKTPLAIIQACVETLIDGAVGDANVRGQFLDRIAEQSHRLHALILDLLHLARIESETEVFSLGNLDLGDAVVQCGDRHRTRAQGRRQTLEIVAPEPHDLPTLAWADEEAVRQILDNLVDNALKYTPDEGAVQVSWGRLDNEVFLRVRDTGIGITESDLPRIFERFYRVDKARSRELGGTGLGLSIVKHLAQAMQGAVEATSRISEGTCFTVRLPQADSATRPAEKPTSLE